ncbi:hypothetical protein QBC38DRAFT_345586, partial [Podospora fimiseda]
ICDSVTKWEETTITSVPQTLITIINSYTYTLRSLTGPTPTSYPATITTSVTFHSTAEHRMTFADGQSSTSWTS